MLFGNLDQLNAESNVSIYVADFQVYWTVHRHSDVSCPDNGLL